MNKNGAVRMVTANQPKVATGSLVAPFCTGHDVHSEHPARTRLTIVGFKGPKAHPIRGVTSQCTAIIRY